MGRKILRVAKTSIPKKVAWSLAIVIREGGEAELQTVAAGALNQAIKAIAIARELVSQETDLICRPSFIDIGVGGREYTGIRLVVESYPKEKLITITTPSDVVSA